MFQEANSQVVFFSKSALSDRCAMVALEQVHMYFAEWYLMENKDYELTL